MEPGVRGSICKISDSGHIVWGKAGIGRAWGFKGGMQNIAAYSSDESDSGHSDIHVSKKVRVVLVSDPRLRFQVLQ